MALTYAASYSLTYGVHGSSPMLNLDSLSVLLHALYPEKPGDCIILNSANSTVGQAVLQISKLLKLRAIAVVRDVPGAVMQQPDIVLQGQVPAHGLSAAAAAAAPTQSNSMQNGQHGHQHASLNMLPGNDETDGHKATVGWDRMANYLKAIGASEVLKDTGSFKVRS
jgi:hypothetical protein